MTDLEAQLMERWQAWLKTPGAGERVVAAIRNGDEEAFERLFREVTAHPSWAKAIAAVNARVG